jgi:hypothetical protein
MPLGPKWILLFVCLTLAGATIERARADDAFIGEYAGALTRMGLDDLPVVGQITTEGTDADQYRLILRRAAEVGPPTDILVELPAQIDGANLSIAGRSMGLGWSGALAGDTLTLAGAEPGLYGLSAQLARVERESPTLGQPPPEGAVVLFPYTPGQPTTLDAWTNTQWLTLDDGSVQVAGGGDNKTKQQFHDYFLHVEFLLPLVRSNRGQDRGNSGVYLNERYETQILDSFAVMQGSGDCGSLYRYATPLVNACRPAERWQTYDIRFIAPRLGEDGALLQPGELTVDHNGVRIHDRVAIVEGTGSRKALGNLEFGAILLQQHSNPVRFRNIWLTELNETGTAAGWEHLSAAGGETTDRSRSN